MAKYVMGILGPVSGKVGTVVGARRGATPYLRVYREKIRNPRTEKQREWRARFAMAGRVGIHVAGLLRHVAPTLDGSRRFNIAVRALLREGKLTVDEGAISGIEPGAIHLIAPPLTRCLPRVPQIQAARAGSKVKISWTYPDITANLHILAVTADALMHVEGTQANDTSAATSCELAFSKDLGETKVLVMAYAIGEDGVFSPVWVDFV